MCLWRHGIALFSAITKPSILSQPSRRARRSQLSLDDEVLGRQVRQSFLGSDRTYGARRVWHDVLALDRGCSLHRIERLMREQALARDASTPRLAAGPRRAQRHRDNVLDREF